MRQFFVTCLVILLILSCSKPKEEQAPPTDSTTTRNLDPTPAVVDPIITPIPLTPALIEEIRVKLFIRLSGQNLYDSATVALVEEFSADGTMFDYRLVRHNGPWAGLHECGWDPSAPEVEEEPEENLDRNGDGIDDEERGKYAKPEKCMDYRNEVDTIIIKGSFSELSSAVYANGLKNWRLTVDGTSTHRNFPSLDEDNNVTFDKSVETMKIFTIDEIVPVFFRENLYMKAKILPITEDDLKGMSKDDLGYFRNEIFAMHGHTFKTEKMITYFGKQNWYYPRVNDAGPLLNKMEKRNVEFIKKLEDKR